MPPRTRRNPDEIRITICTTVTVSEKLWRANMRLKGIDMTGVVTGAHVADTVKATTLAVIEAMGYPQPPDTKG